MRFLDMPLQGGTLDAVVAMGYEEPTPIQDQAIVPLLDGRDVVGQARTGTGKTAAFGIPLVDKFRDARDGIPALVLVPTRELAIQVAEVLEDIAKGSPLRVVSVYGGAGFGKQLDGLQRRGPKVVVATPGRLLDLVERRALDLTHVEYWVLDEADRMLDMGFVGDMRKVAKMVPRNRQTALFSATIPASVEKLIQEFTSKPIRIKVDDGETTIPKAEQFVVYLEKSQKMSTLLTLLHDEQPKRGIVFTRTKHLAKRLSKQLSEKGWRSVALQGNMTQGQRERAMASFKAGDSRLLIATDVAARGLDVEGITHVVNFDLPDPDSYVHRVGRTARNGAEGRAFTFVQSDEHRDFRQVQDFAGRRLDPLQVELVGESPRGPDPVVEAPRAAPARPKGGQGPRRGPKPGGQHAKGPASGGRGNHGRRRNSGGGGRSHGRGGQGRSQGSRQ